MIDPSEFLLSLANIAVALAGFSGLIVAIRATGSDGWHPRDIWSLSWMMGASVGALFLALLPLWLVALGLEAVEAYRASATVASAYCAAFLVLMTSIGRALRRRGYPRRIPCFPAGMVFLLTVALVTVGCAAAGLVPDARLHGFYTGGLIALLLITSLALGVFLVLLGRTVQERGGGVTVNRNDRERPEPNVAADQADGTATKGR